MLSTDLASKAQSVLDFAAHLQQVLSRGTQSSSPEVPEISLYIQALPLPRKELTPDHRREFDRTGVALWNNCCKRGRGDVDPKARANLAKISAFSCLLIESATTSKRKNLPRLFKNALKATRHCLDAGLFEIGSKLLAQLAIKQEDLSPRIKQDGDAGGDADAGGVVDSLRAQYILLRIALAWKQDRLELAEHFYSQLGCYEAKLELGVASQLLDLCYEIGNHQLAQNQGTLAARWLKRGCVAADQYDAQFGDADMHEFRLTLLHTYVRALLPSEGPAAGDEVFETLRLLQEVRPSDTTNPRPSLMEQDFGHTFPVMLLQLEVHAQDLIPKVDDYCAALVNIIRSAHLNPSNHELIMHHVHGLKAQSARHAVEVLETYIVTRLASTEEDGWIEGAIITLTWFMTTTSYGPDTFPPSDLMSFFDRVRHAWNKHLGSEATHGVLALLWKKLEQSFVEGLKSDTIQWCRCALHELLHNAGDGNIGKIERKLIMCHMELAELQAACEVWERMSAPRKQHALSRHLRYCLALRCGNEAEARSALVSLAAVHDDQNSLLFAAVSEAMKHGGKLQAARLLQLILDKCNGNLSPEVDVCALSRCTAHLLFSALSEDPGFAEELLSRLCGLFRSAASFTRESPTDDGRRSALRLAECRWFEKASYTWALQNLNSWPARYVIDLLQYSCQISYPPATTESARLEKALHEAKAMSVQVALYTAQARSSLPTWTVEDIPRSSYSSKAPPSPAEIKKTLYRNAVDKYRDLQARVEEVRRSECPSTQAVLEQMTRELAVLTPLAFEAVLYVTCPSQPDDPPLDERSLNEMVDLAIEHRPPHKTYSCLADMILSACSVPRTVPENGHTELPTRPYLSTSTATNLLGKLIQGLRNDPDYDMAQASRWIRCVVQVALDQRAPSSTVPRTDDDRGLKTVEMATGQAQALARSAATTISGSHQTCHQQPYPPEELEWLATTLFNLAIDLYMVSCTGNLPKNLTSDEANPSTDLTTPQFWASKATEIADVLAGGVTRTGSSSGQTRGAVAVAGTGDGDHGSNGDGGLLAGILRERCQSLGWHV